MVDTPNDALQSHKVSGRNLPRGRVSGQKSLENPGNPEKLSPGGGRGGEGTGVGDHLGTIRDSSFSIGPGQGEIIISSAISVISLSPGRGRGSVGYVVQ